MKHCLALLFLFLFTLVGQAAAQTCVKPPDGLVSWWDADAVSGATAYDIKDGNDGTMLNGVGIDSGNVGNAFSFNGSDYQYIQLPFDSGDIFTDQFTVDAWAFPTKLSNFANGQAILENDDQVHPSVGRGMFFGVYAGIQLPFKAIGIFHNTEGSQFSVEADTSLNVFHHYALTYDGSELCLYQDGVLEACTPAFGNVNDNDVKFRIAGNVEIPDPQRYFGGKIDEVEIFNRALSAEEIQAIYHAGSAGKCKNVPFADLTIVKAKIGFNAAFAINDSFKVKGEFTLGATSDGIDPSNDDVLVTVGTSSLTIPAGSFLEEVSGRFRFEGTIDGAAVEAVIKQLTGDFFKIRVKAEGVNLTNTSNPLTIRFIIGDDTGTADIRLKGKLKSEDGV